MLTSTPPTSQKDRPISFLLDSGSGTPVTQTLVVRPEDLSVHESPRVAVHQTLGDGDAQGWVDDFGRGLPSVSIEGHTGWRAAAGSSDDGMAVFVNLHKLLMQDFPDAKQKAISAGTNPQQVKLLFADTLDGLLYQVQPTAFALRRSRSRPLLCQYNIQLQVVTTSLKLIQSKNGVDSNATGLAALDNVLNTIDSVVDKVAGWVNSAVSSVMGVINSIGDVVKKFVQVTQRVLSAVQKLKSAVVGGINAVANGLIGIAKSFAQAGANIFNTLRSLASIPMAIKQALGRVAAAFHTAVCLLSNSLQGTKSYSDYSALYGASNCSSTTGGRPASSLLDNNAFSLLPAAKAPVSMSPSAVAGLGKLAATDPVTSPLSPTDIGHHAALVHQGFYGVTS